jgi:hypothetical protein
VISRPLFYGFGKINKPGQRDFCGNLLLRPAEIGPENRAAYQLGKVNRVDIRAFARAEANEALVEFKMRRVRGAKVLTIAD